MQIQKKEKSTKVQCIKFYAIDNRQEIGYAYLFLIFNQTGGYYYGLLEDVFVKEEYRKQGIGAQLVNAIIDECKQRQLDHLIATSRLSRPQIHQWYLKLGFYERGKEFRIDFK